MLLYLGTSGIKIVFSFSYLRFSDLAVIVFSILTCCFNCRPDDTPWDGGENLVIVPARIWWGFYISLQFCQIFILCNFILAFQVLLISSAMSYYKWNISLVLHPGTFKLTLQFTEDYPNKPPTVRFVSRMFHPNSK